MTELIVLTKSDTEGNPTFCNDAPYPPHDFTMVVWERDWSHYNGDCIRVEGRVTDYKGKPEILVDRASQVTKCEQSSNAASLCEGYSDWNISTWPYPPVATRAHEDITLAVYSFAEAVRSYNVGNKYEAREHLLVSSLIFGDFNEKWGEIMDSCK